LTAPSANSRTTFDQIPSRAAKVTNATLERRAT
jgi:hypothetical protein